MGCGRRRRSGAGRVRRRGGSGSARPDPRGSPYRLRPGTRRERLGAGTGEGYRGILRTEGRRVGVWSRRRRRRETCFSRRAGVAALQRASPAARAAGTCRAWSIGAAGSLRASPAISRPIPCRSASWAPAGRSAHLRLPSQSALIREQANRVVSTCHLLCVICCSFIVLRWQVAKGC